MKLFKFIAVTLTCIGLFSAGTLSTQAANPLQSPVPTARPTARPGTGPVICTVLSGISLNVRSGPSVGYAKVGSLRGGSRFVCLTRRGNWLSLVYKGRIRWVYRPYVRCNRAI